MGTFICVASSSASEFINITSLEDVKPFAGKVVKYTSTSNYLTFSYSDSDVYGCYGLISAEGNKVHRILPSSRSALTYTLSDQEISSFNLEFKLPDQTELQDIIRKLNSDELIISDFEKSIGLVNVSLQLQHIIMIF